MTARSILRLIAVAVLGVALSVPLAGAAKLSPSRISLIYRPGFQPENTIGPARRRTWDPWPTAISMPLICVPGAHW